MGWRDELEALKKSDPTAAEVAESIIQIRYAGEYSCYDSFVEKFGKELAKLLLSNDQFMVQYDKG